MTSRELLSPSTESVTRHQAEIEANRRVWFDKPILRSVYESFYKVIAKRIDETIPGRIVEVGSGIGNLRGTIPSAIATDLFPHDWLDLTCDGYRLPFAANSLSHLLLFDVFHHLERPQAFLHEARRVLNPRGRLLIFDVFISIGSWPAYGLFHSEPVGWRSPIDMSSRTPPERQSYYAAQGNVTRLFFRDMECPDGWDVFHREVMPSYAYLWSGGFSAPAMYPGSLLPAVQKVDAFLARWPALFGARALVGLTPTNIAAVTSNRTT